MSPSKPNESQSPVFTTSSAQTQTTDLTNRKDSAADKVLDSLSAAIKVPQNVTNYAENLYKKAWNSRNFEKKDQNSVVGACIYIACRQMQVPRPFQEVFAFSTDTIDEAMSSFGAMEDFFVGETRSWKVKQSQYRIVHEINSPWAIVDAIQRLQVECIEEEEAYNQAVAGGRIHKAEM